MNEIALLPVEKISSARLRPSRVRWRIVALLMVYVAVCHFNRISMSVAGAEQIMPGYGIDETVMGLVYSAYLLLYTLCMTPGGWFIDRYGPRAALMLVGFGSAVFVALTGLTGMLLASGAALITALFIVRGCLGVVSAPIHPGAARAVGFWMPPAARSTANGLVVGALCVGVASTYLIFGELSDWLGWSGAFVVSGAATALLALLWTSYATNAPRGHRSVNEAEQELIGAETKAPGETPSERASLWGNHSLMLLTLSYATVNYVEYLFFYWMQYYFDTVLGLGKTTGRIYATVLTLAMGVGIVLGGWLADRAVARYGPRRGRALVPVVGMVISAVVLALGLLAAEPSISMACFAVAMAAIGASEGPFWTSAIELGGPRGGTAAGILNTGGNAGGLLAPVVTPLFSRFFGWQAGLGLAAAVCLVGAIFWIWIDPRGPADALSCDNKRPIRRDDDNE